MKPSCSQPSSLPRSPVPLSAPGSRHEIFRRRRRAARSRPGCSSWSAFTGAGPGLVKYRTRNLAGRWSAWRVFSAEDALPDRGREQRATRGWRIASPFWTGASNAIQYRTVGRVARLRAYFVRAPRQASPAKRADLAGAPPIITRAGWHADESIRRGAPYYADSVHYAIVHHTAGSNSYTKAQSASIVRAIELYHVQGNGWNDIGYNFLVDKYGQVFEGRYGGIDQAGDRRACGGVQHGLRRDRADRRLQLDVDHAAARAALVSLIAWRLDLDHVDPLRASCGSRAATPLRGGQGGHPACDLGAPRRLPDECPGQSLYAQLPSIVRRSPRPACRSCTRR